MANVAFYILDMATGQSPKGKRMPYEIRKQGENYEVINKDTGDVKATHEPPDAKDKAERQVKLLHAVENDPSWE